jgi:hypothetical protein
MIKMTKTNDHKNKTKRKTRQMGDTFGKVSEVADEEWNSYWAQIILSIEQDMSKKQIEDSCGKSI